MGNASGSMFYAIAGFLVLYFAGVLIYQIYGMITKGLKKLRSNKEKK